MSETLLAQLSTPAVVVDLDVLERNISRMADARARRRRSAAAARQDPQVPGDRPPAALGGRLGLSLAKLGEAEIFVNAGFDDVFLAYPIVGEDKARRLLALSDRARLAVGVDSVEGARSLAGTFHSAGRTLEVVLKVDVGYGRVGVLPEQPSRWRAGSRSSRAAHPRRLHPRGPRLPGRDRAGVEEIARLEGERLVGSHAAARGWIHMDEVSVGSTPTAAVAMRVGGVTECRPGNYVFHDASQVALGTCGLEDCALTIVATVVSVPSADRAVVDAGSKTFSSDPLRPKGAGHGRILGRESR